MAGPDRFKQWAAAYGSVPGHSDAVRRIAFDVMASHAASAWTLRMLQGVFLAGLMGSCRWRALLTKRKEPVLGDVPALP